MQKTIHEILTNELNRIHAASQKSGLELDDFRKLDLLIKVHKSFATPPDSEKPTEKVESIPIEDILKGLDDQADE